MSMQPHVVVKRSRAPRRHLPPPRRKSSGVATPRELALWAAAAGFGPGTGVLGSSGSPSGGDRGAITELITAVAIALAESGGRVNATNRNPNGSIDRGPWQINSVHEQFDEQRLVSDGPYNATAAFAVYSQRKARGENGFNAWTAFRSGAYKKHMARARKGVDQAGGLQQTGDIGGNWATDLDEKVSGAIPSFDELAASVWPVLLQAALAGTGLALIGYSLARLFGAPAGKVAKQVVPPATNVAKAIS